MKKGFSVTFISCSICCLLEPTHVKNIHLIMGSFIASQATLLPVEKWHAMCAKVTNGGKRKIRGGKKDQNYCKHWSSLVLLAAVAL